MHGSPSSSSPVAELMSTSFEAGAFEVSVFFESEAGLDLVPWGAAIRESAATRTSTKRVSFIAPLYSFLWGRHSCRQAGYQAGFLLLLKTSRQDCRPRAANGQWASLCDR